MEKQTFACNFIQFAWFFNFLVLVKGIAEKILNQIQIMLEPWKVFLQAIQRRWNNLFQHFYLFKFLQLKVFSAIKILTKGFPLNSCCSQKLINFNLTKSSNRVFYKHHQILRFTLAAIMFRGENSPKIWTAAHQLSQPKATCAAPAEQPFQLQP